VKRIFARQVETFYNTCVMSSVAAAAVVITTDNKTVAVGATRIHGV